MNCQTASPFGNTIFISILLALATFAVYFPVRNYGFVDYDDSTYFFANPHVLTGLTWANVKWAFTSRAYSNWHPLTWLSLMLDVQFFGKSAAAPHITNVLLHATNSILLFLLLRQLTSALWRSAAVAMLFALHPLHVESVAWVTERKDVLSGLSGLLTLLFYARHIDSRKKQTTVLVSAGAYHLSPSYWVSLFFFACGLMSKPMLVTLPFVMLLLDFWPLQRFLVAPKLPAGGEGGPVLLKSDEGGNTSPPYRLVVEKIPFFLLSIASSFVTFRVQAKSGATTMLINVPTAMRVETPFVAYAHYLFKTFWPRNLATPYPHPACWPAWLVIFSIVLFAALCLAAVASREKFPWLFTGWFWFAGMLVPVIGVVQVGMPAMADRYVYLPLIGLLIIVVWSAGELCAQWQPTGRFIIVGSSLLFLVCAARARNQVNVWENDGTLFGHAVAATQNNYIASLNLAFWYSNHGRVQDALNCYDDAMRMSSNDLTALSYSTHDRLQEALYCYYNTLRLNPDDPTELYNIGNAFAKLGDWDESICDYRHALEVTPDQPDIMNNLGFALVKKKQYDEAITNFLAVLKFAPDSVGAHNNLASVFFVQGRYGEAARQFQAALQISPDDPRIWANLGGTYVRLGQTNLAVKYYQQALQLQPGNQQIRGELNTLGAHLSN